MVINISYNAARKTNSYSGCMIMRFVNSFDDFQSIPDEDSVFGMLSRFALQVIISMGMVEKSDGADVGILAIQTSYGETETRVMGEPDEVAIGVERDFCDLVEGDA